LGQARKAAALAENYAADDPAAEARLEKEAKDEERDIKRVCNELNVQIHEVTMHLEKETEKPL
jgi:OTU domain-containing protein 6